MSLWLLLPVRTCLSWSAPKVMQHGLMQPVPMDIRPKDEKRTTSWVGVARLQLVSG
ncbi:hypothetical protein HanPSC8_Chr01g0042941 [Helianthus annuus]|nr:hypothetical protein HanPSC8_Chr01g0042941 [Helianthus annuus]